MLLAAGAAVAAGENLTKFSLAPVDYAILFIYLVFVLGIGWVLKKQVNSSEDFFLSGRSIPGWVTGLAFISANLGAQELIGMVASGAQYGIMTSHYYWIGAIPAMVFLGVVMMPLYYGSKARSVPEFLKLRYDEKTRTFNSLSFAVLTIVSSGISMHLLAKLIVELLGFGYWTSLLAISAIVLAYVLKGGITSAIYTEVLQFFMIVFGIAPLTWVALKDIGGWDGLLARINQVSPGHMHSWVGTGTADNALGAPWYGILIGLGFVLSFGYWCTNFAEVQRAMVAKDMGAARRTPIIGAIPKMLMPAIVILPGIIAFALTSKGLADGYAIPHLIKDGQVVLDTAGHPVSDYNAVLSSMIFHYFPSGILGLALTALMASFMSGMAANVTAFNTVWTYDIYQTHFAKQKDDASLLRMGKIATVAGIAGSVGFAFFASQYKNIMELLQSVFGLVNAPLFATFLLGMFWKRSNSRGAFWGLATGTAAAILFLGLSTVKGDDPGIKCGWFGHVFELRTGLAQSFVVASVAFFTTFLVNAGLSVATARDKQDAQLKGLVYSLTEIETETDAHFFQKPAVLGAIVLGACAFLNWYFW